jgi:hypothetical protein
MSFDVYSYSIRGIGGKVKSLVPVRQVSSLRIGIKTEQTIPLRNESGT